MNMPKGSPELTNARRNEIIDACEQLYDQYGFKEITLKKISEVTSFSRPSIYNYFQTKEEIFLALLAREYEAWIEELNEMMDKHASMTREGFAENLAHSVEHRRLLLKILAMNHYDMESGTRDERLIQFKTVYGETLRTVERCLEQYFPGTSSQDRQNFIYAFFPFMFGIFPYAVATEKQLAAMDAAQVNYVKMTIYELTYNFLIQLLPQR